MIAALIKNWWLLAICGVFEAITSVIYFNHAGQGFHSSTDLMLLGKLAIAAGACTIAAAMWGSAKRTGWLLALNGLALGALGLILDGIAGFKISFRTIALLMIVMAISIGIFELTTARSLGRRGSVAGSWFLRFVGAASVGFALVFFALGFGPFKLRPGSHPDLLWLGAYFAFSAICHVRTGLALKQSAGGHQSSGQRSICRIDEGESRYHELKGEFRGGLRRLQTAVWKAS